MTGREPEISSLLPGKDLLPVTQSGVKGPGNTGSINHVPV